MQVKVFITPKAGILDPQGRAIEHSLHQLGFSTLQGVGVGKYIVLELAAASAEEVRAEVTKMCEQLLANTVIEDYSFEVVSS